MKKARITTRSSAPAHRVEEYSLGRGKQGHFMGCFDAPRRVIMLV